MKETLNHTREPFLKQICCLVTDAMLKVSHMVIKQYLELIVSAQYFDIEGSI
jgi:hypothetical protein